MRIPGGLPQYTPVGPLGAARSVTNTLNIAGSIGERILDHQFRLDEAQYQADIVSTKTALDDRYKRWSVDNKNNNDWQTLPNSFQEYMKKEWENILPKIKSDRAREEWSNQFNAYLGDKMVGVVTMAQERHAKVLLGQYKSDYNTIISQAESPDAVQTLINHVNAYKNGNIIDPEKAATDMIDGLKSIMEGRIYKLARTEGYEPVIQAITANPPVTKIGDQIITFDQDELETIKSNLDTERKEQKDILDRQIKKLDEQAWQKGWDMFLSGSLNTSSILALRRDGLIRGGDNEQKLYRLYEDLSRPKEESLAPLKRSLEGALGDLKAEISDGYDPDLIYAKMRQLQDIYGQYLSDDEWDDIMSAIDKAKNTRIPREITATFDQMGMSPAIIGAVKGKFIDHVTPLFYNDDGSPNPNKPDYAKLQAIAQSYAAPYMSELFLRAQENKMKAFQAAPGRGLFGSAKRTYEKDITEMDDLESATAVLTDAIKSGVFFEYSEEDKAKFGEFPKYLMSEHEYWARRYPAQGMGRFQSIRLENGLYPVVTDDAGTEWAIDIDPVLMTERWKPWPFSDVSRYSQFHDYGNGRYAGYNTQSGAWEEVSRSVYEEGNR